METAAVILIVTAVTAYLIRRAIRNHKEGGMCSSCSGSCPYSDQCPGVKEE
ncbi:MAG: FeoB-associated Cys-rich membrane protein [Candidatus Sabulitectum sp.]|nr:FeoB-associated Cys-rich membrane protein [Candidatus Sabulitectum sp.]